jgi:hypothetical protein
MENITAYVKEKTEKCIAIHDEYLDAFNNSEFDTFLSLIAEKHYKNEKMLTFFRNLNTYIDCVTKEKLVDDLKNAKNKFVKARLTNNPVNFSTNPMTNLIRLWNFELYAEIIIEIDILLSKCKK